MDSRQEKLEVLSNQVNFWENKFRFSFISLLSFLVISMIYLVQPVFGFIGTIVLFSTVLVFVQQTIRSYNYLNFSKFSYNSFFYMYEEIEKIKGDN
jgi:hypothetical protein